MDGKIYSCGPSGVTTGSQTSPVSSAMIPRRTSGPTHHPCVHMKEALALASFHLIASNN